MINKAKFAPLKLRVNAFFQQLGLLTFPNYCCFCDGASGNSLLCAGCIFELPYLAQHTTCQQCGLGLSSESNYCGHCLQQPPAFSRTYIPLVYDYPINLLIHGFKYRGNLTYGKLLGQLLTDHIAHAQQGGDWQAPDIIIPTPMHWSKRWQRGFNQAEILGQAIAHQLNIPMQTRWVKRIHKTPAQKELTRAQRQQNLRRAFFIDEKRQAQIKGKRIALVDDVVTTTATMRELSKLLMNAGAIDVQLWCLARTL